MKISNTRPPQWIWDQAHKQFQIDDSVTIYTYGDTLHNPAPIRLDDFLVAHEGIHQRQQEAMGADAWWHAYFKDSVFRLEQEVDAYSAQYREFCRQCKDRNTQDRYLRELAKILAHPMYGGIIKEDSARNRIKYHSPTPPLPKTAEKRAIPAIPPERGGELAEKSK